MLVLITNAVRPYYHDIANLLGLPLGCTYRFRYDRRWIAPGLNFHSALGTNGLVVARDFESGQLLPLRQIKLTGITTVGRINYVEFEVERYYSKTTQEELADRVTAGLQALGVNTVGGSPLQLLGVMLELPQLPSRRLSASELNEYWAETVERLGRWKNFRDFSFLRFLEFKDEHDNIAVVKAGSRASRGVVLRPGRTYFLDVIQYIPGMASDRESLQTPYDVRLRSASPEIVAVRDTQRVVGKYDLLRFVVRTGEKLRKHHGDLELVNDQPGQAGLGAIQGFIVPVTLALSGWQRVSLGARFAAAGVALSGLALAHVLGGYLATKTSAVGPEVAADALRATSALLLVLASGGYRAFASDMAKEAGTKLVGK